MEIEERLRSSEGFSLTHLLRDFKAIKEVHEETNISIESLCRLSKVSGSLLRLAESY